MGPDATLADGDQARLIAAMRRPAVFGSDCRCVTVLETHISYVLLTGKYAYKIKKNVNLGFLDFTTLEARRHYCERELELNRRLAPALYLDVVAITGSADSPVVGGMDAPLEYAVKMREFPQDALASRLLARNSFGAHDIDVLAAKVAAFHGRVAVAAPNGRYGAPDDILRIAMQNFLQIRPSSASAADQAELDALAQWIGREHEARRANFRERRHGGSIRECHGDLHLGNIARIDGEITVFDCIEFNDAFRWIDVMNEVAFTVMDLQDRGRGDLGQRFLNAYLEKTGDYAGLLVLPFYLAYRAMVRAKVARLRATQLGPGDSRDTVFAEYRGYIDLARTYTEPPRPAIIITHGVAGSGKSTLSQALLETVCAVRIRADVERKRLYGIGPLEHLPSDIDRGLYAADATTSTYDRMCAQVSCVVAAGKIAIVDAAFLKRWQRDMFRTLAVALKVRFLIVSFEANAETLRRRVAERAASDRDASDAGLAVLEHQLRVQDALAPEECADAVKIDAAIPLDRFRLRETWSGVIERLAYPVACVASTGTLAEARHAPTV